MGFENKAEDDVIVNTAALEALYVVKNMLEASHAASVEAASLFLDAMVLTRKER